MDSYLFVFSFGQSIGKVDKFTCNLNMLDVLLESLTLVSGGFVFCLGCLIVIRGFDVCGPSLIRYVGRDDSDGAAARAKQYGSHSHRLVDAEYC